MARSDVWAERIAKMRATYPGLTRVWEGAFNDEAILGRAIRELISTGPGRQTPEVAEGIRRWRELTGLGYSTLRFPASLHELTGGATIATVAAATGLDTAHVTALFNGTDPTIDDLTTIAAAYRRDPTWFHEYRVIAVAAAVADALAANPERSALYAAHLAHD